MGPQREALQGRHFVWYAHRVGLAQRATRLEHLELHTEERTGECVRVSLSGGAERVAACTHVWGVCEREKETSLSGRLTRLSRRRYSG